MPIAKGGQLWLVHTQSHTYFICDIDKEKYVSADLPLVDKSFENSLPIKGS